MSVVNQMLRDLDRRQAGEETAVYTQHLRPVGVHRRKPLVMIGTVMLVAIATVYAGLQYVNRTTPHPVEIAKADAPIAMQSAFVEAPPERPSPVVEAVMEIEPTAADSASSAAEAGPKLIAEIAAPPASDMQAQLAAQTSLRHSRESGNPGIAPTPSAPPSTAHSRESASARHSRESGNPEIAASAAQPSLAMEQDTSATKIDVRPHVPPARTAESEFRRAATLINQARSEEARAALRTALELDARHEGARQTLAVLLIEARAMSEAEVLLREGLRLNPTQTNFAIVLARLKLDHGDAAGALQVLREHGAAASNNAEYRAFAAALLQRMDRHPEALDEYRAALTASPNVGVWWVGLGLSFEATGEPGKAAEAFARARATGTLSADVAQFVEGKLQTVR